MNDLMIFKYLVWKYCIRWSLIILIFFIFLIDLFLIPIPTMALFLIIMFGSRIIVWWKMRDLRGIFSLTMSGIYSIVLSEIVYPTLLICALLQRL